MPCCGPRLPALLLAHVNLLLVLFSGAALAAAARLKWDPSAYVPLREALPNEYRLACGALLAGALATLLLAHLALAAVAARCRPALRRAALYTYALLTLAQLAGEVCAAAWVGQQARVWAQSQPVAQLMELLEAHDHLLAALQLLGHWNPLPQKLNALIEEAEADLPRNGYAAGGAAAVLLLLQAAAVLLALLAACAPTGGGGGGGAGGSRRGRSGGKRGGGGRDSLSTLDSVDAYFERDDSRARLAFQSEADGADKPLRTTYKNGRLVVL